MIVSILLFVFSLDQLSKFFILRQVPFGKSIPILSPFFHLTLVANTGVAFGLFKGNSNLFIVGGIAILFWIYRFIRKNRVKDLWVRAGLGLVSGGALGNLMDRLRLGYVVDFLDFRVWPVFNIADSCIFIGTVLFIATCFGKKDFADSKTDDTD